MERLNNYFLRPIDVAFHGRLRQLYFESKLSQKAYAKKVGLTPKALNMVLMRHRSFSLKTVILVAWKERVSVDWLLGLSNVRERQRSLPGADRPSCPSFLIDR
jgi:hypothetical protein